MTTNKMLIEKISSGQPFEAADIVRVLRDFSPEDDRALFERADRVRREIYGKKVYARGLIEFSNICKNNCLYCGIRRGNHALERYRLTKDEILECCRTGHTLGFKTFVLQSGEDPFFDDDMICDIVSGIKEMFPDCAVTLSVGEKERASYQKYFDAGADRFLLRHETASKSHYEKLHPSDMSYENRMSCLLALKEIGFQTGAGFMTDSPFQSPENLAEDLLFLRKFKPHMVGIGPFIPQKDTPFAEYPKGKLRTALVMVALTRLILPHALIPSTTALGTLTPNGRELGLKVGANVVMPNLTPQKLRNLYALYDNKLTSGEEAAESLDKLRLQIKTAGYDLVMDRGDYIP